MGPDRTWAGVKNGGQSLRTTPPIRQFLRGLEVAGHLAGARWRMDGRPRLWAAGSGLRSGSGKGADMTDKSPRKAASKKSGKSLKEKRQAKKEKEDTKKSFAR
jgi:hypothetical protein